MGLSKITETTHFDVPRTVCVEADIETVCDLNLDIFGGEQWDSVHDVISVIFDRNEVAFVTVRTMERPWRGTILLPRNRVESVGVHDPA